MSKKRWTNSECIRNWKGSFQQFLIIRLAARRLRRRAGPPSYRMILRSVICCLLLLVSHYSTGLQKNCFLLIPRSRKNKRGRYSEKWHIPIGPLGEQLSPITTASYGLDCTVIGTVTKSIPCLLSLQLFCTMLWCNTDLVQVLFGICCNKIKLCNVHFLSSRRCVRRNS